ncbi:MAG: hypothetical protein H6839_01590 [Planctomycetes bacterium]|nr:hypothetical protein [Planctomycetota bacterium]
MLRCALILLLLLSSLLAGCRNAPEENRKDLWRDVQNTEDAQRENMRKRLRTIIAGDVENARDEDPHMRATAVQGLGEIGDPDDAELILDTLMGPLADGSVLVRIECAIALGKLKYESRTDARRVTSVISLRNRIAFDRDETGRPYETEFLVRSAMLNSLIAIGGRDCAAALYDVASRLNSDLEDVEGSLFTSATDRGLLDRCFEGLSILTGVSEEEAARNRFENDDLSAHLDWWADRISEMPDN